MNKTKTDIISTLLLLKKEMDNGAKIICRFSVTSRVPFPEAVIHYYSNNKSLLKAIITDFNPPRLPPISFDDIIELETYINQNYQTLCKIQKLKAFI